MLLGVDGLMFDLLKPARGLRFFHIRNPEKVAQDRPYG
jgi:hypothetical protein